MSSSAVDIVANCEAVDMDLFVELVNCDSVVRMHAIDWHADVNVDWISSNWQHLARDCLNQLIRRSYFVHEYDICYWHEMHFLALEQYSLTMKHPCCVVHAMTSNESVLLVNLMALPYHMRYDFDRHCLCSHPIQIQHLHSHLTHTMG